MFVKSKLDFAKHKKNNVHFFFRSNENQILFLASDQTFRTKNKNLHLKLREFQNPYVSSVKYFFKLKMNADTKTKILL